PASRAPDPKQVLPLVAAHSLLQATVQRVAARARFAAPLVIANDEHRFIIAEQLRQIDAAPQAIVLEPVGRNTAPAACIASLILAASNPSALLLVMPSDHVIADGNAFRAAVARAAEAARAGALVTFGIAADRPETGYGYIRRGAPLQDQDGCYAVAAFVEKPDRERAQSYVASGDYAWNSGIFLFPAGLYVDELTRRHPELVAGRRTALEEAQRDLTLLRLDNQSFSGLRGESIDHADMDPTNDAALLPVSMGRHPIAPG